MPAASNPPDADQVRRFLLGLLDDPEHQRIEQLLAESSDWLAVAESTATKDALLETLQAVGNTTEPHLPASVTELIARLERICPATAAAETVAPLATLAPGAPATVTSPPSSYPFLDPPDQPSYLGRLGGCRVVKELGKGGMGIVFLAEDPALNRRVAIKVMRPDIAAHPKARQRFLREAQAAAALEHEHVVPIYQVGEAGGAAAVPFIVMPFLAGEALSARLKRDGALPIAEVLRLGRETAQGLAAAHAVGLIHRDIKPDNLWLYDPPHADVAASRGQVKILDFGLARPMAASDIELTQPGAMIGTPAYMAPEQADGLAVDARSDLFSLGCVLYQMATGRRPFQGVTLTAILRALAADQPSAPHLVRPEVPRPLSDLIVRLLAKSPDERPASARAVADALRAIEGGAPAAIGATAPPVPGTSTAMPEPKKEGPIPSLVPGSPKSRWIAGTLAAVILVIVALGSWLGFRSSGPVGPMGNPTQPAVYRGLVDVLIWKTEANGQVRKVRLIDAGALPLRSGDQIRVTAQVEPAAYLYVFWVDSEGEAAPIYPWQPGKWGSRPATEEPVTRLDLPAKLSAGFTLTGKTDGMETLVLLARDAPLDIDDAVLRRDLAGLPKMNLVQDARAAVWFENGRVVENDANRKRANFEIKDINDPVLRLQELLKEKLQPRGQFTSAVSFTRLAK